MQLIDGRPVYAATDLVGFLACGHRLALERAAMHGLVEKPVRNDPSIELIARRGEEHERPFRRTAGSALMPCQQADAQDGEVAHDLVVVIELLNLHYCRFD